MPGGRSPREKGKRGEREFCKIFGGERVPLSGSAGGSFSGDAINVPGFGKGEIKRRGSDAFKFLYSALGENDFLAVRADKKKWLVIFPQEKALEIQEKLKNL